MNTWTKLLHCAGCTDRLRYQRNIAALGVGKALVDLAIITTAPSTDAGAVAAAWLNPYVLIGPWASGDMPWSICATTVLFFASLVWNTVHRLRDAGIAHGLGLLVCTPYAGPVFALVCCFLPTKKHTVWDLV